MPIAIKPPKPAGGIKIKGPPRGGIKYNSVAPKGVQYDMNTVPAELLIKAGLTEALVQNLVAARQEHPFSDVDDARLR